MPIIQRESGLNLPNSMTPGAWVIVAVVIVAIVLGVSLMVWRVWSKRVKWQSLGFMGVQFYAEDSAFSADLLRNAIDKARAFLILHTKWSSSEVEKALTGFNVYIFADDVNAGAPGRSGYQSGNVLGVNRKLTTLCHEMGHLLHERLEKIVDYDHARWEQDGFVLAERAYSDWLAST